MNRLKNLLINLIYKKNLKIIIYFKIDRIYYCCKIVYKKKIVMNNVLIIIIFKLFLFSNLLENVWIMFDKNLNSKFFCILYVNEYSDIFIKIIFFLRY